MVSFENVTGFFVIVDEERLELPANHAKTIIKQKSRMSFIACALYLKVTVGKTGFGHRSTQLLFLKLVYQNFLS